MTMICAATGKPCPYKCNECGEYPCKDCSIGKEWQNQPILHDDK